MPVLIVIMPINSVHTIGGYFSLHLYTLSDSGMTLHLPKAVFNN